MGSGVRQNSSIEDYDSFSKTTDNGIDSTITLEIDKETLIERMQEYYGGKVNNRS